MRLYPYENFYIETQLSPEKIERLLRNNLQTEPSFWIFFKSTDFLPYYGWATINRFQIRRNTSYRHAFLPVISGTIAGETSPFIHIKMRLSVAVQISLLLWTVIMGYYAVKLSIKELREGEFDSSVLIGYGMLAFYYLFATIWFKLESLKTKRFLIDLFEGKIVAMARTV